MPLTEAEGGVPTSATGMLGPAGRQLRRSSAAVRRFWVSIVAYVVPVVLAALDMAFTVKLTQLLVLGPCLAAVSSRVRGVAVNAAFVLLLMTYLAVPNKTWGTPQQAFTTVGALAVGAVCVLVTLRRERAQRWTTVVEERRAILADVVESANEAIVGCLLDGTVTIWNPAAERLYGYTPVAAVGRNIRMLYPYDATEEELSLFGDRIGAGQSIDQDEAVRIHRDGTVLHLLITVSPMRSTAGVVIGAITLARDLKPLREAESTRAKLEHQVHRLRRVESLSKLAGGIAHDFNNLLAIITSCTEFIHDEADDSVAVRSDVAQIRTAADRAAQLTRQLLQFARGEHRPARTVDLNVLIGDMQGFLHRTVGSAVDLVFEPGPEAALVHADPGRLEQALLHLITNASDAMPAGGTLTICTQVQGPAVPSGRARGARNGGAPELAGGRCGEAAAEMPHGDDRGSRAWGLFTDADVSSTDDTAGRPGRRVRLSVRDTGVGMAPDVAERVFEPFFSTKGHGNGAGLGLASVYGIVTDAAGQIDVDTALGHGTTFTLDFPLDDQPTPVENPPTKEAKTPADFRILVVDDQQPIRDLVGRILLKAGYSVLLAESGARGLQLGTEQPIDLLLTDLVMPELSGQCLAASLVERRRDLPVLFMTGYHDRLLDVAGADSGADILSKPFTEKELLDRVRILLDAAGNRERPLADDTSLEVA